MHFDNGWSMLELLAILLIIVILLSIATPSLERIVLETRQTADINALVTAVQLARSEAAKRSHATILCTTRDWTACADSVAYEQGWMVLPAESPDSAALVADRSPLFTYAPRSSGSIRSNRTQFVFHPFSQRSTNGTITFCDRRGAAFAQTVVLSYTGRPRVTAPGGDRLPACAS